MNAQRMMVAATLLVVVALILSACGGGAAPTAAPQPTSPPAQPTAAPKVGVTYKIGFAPDATGGGAFLGEPEAKVGEILVARLKKDGVKGPDGVMHPIEVLVKDTESKPDTAVSVARRFVTEDKVVALIMGSTTALSVAVADVAEETKTPYISMASASAIIIDPKTTKMRPWVFKVAQSNSDVAVLQGLHPPRRSSRLKMSASNLAVCWRWTMSIFRSRKVKSLALSGRMAQARRRCSM